MNAILDIISESDGSTSSTRVAAVGIVVGVMGLVIYCAVTSKTLPALPVEYVYLVLAGLGAKVWQKKYEDKPTDPKPAVATKL